MRSWGRALVLGLTLSFGVTSCAAVVSALPKAITVITDATLIVDQIASFVDGVFQVSPNADLQAKISTALKDVRAALVAANRAAAGAQDLTQAQLDAAFDDFRAAYQTLIALVAPLGVSTGSGLKAAPGTLTVPEPLAVRL